jgi:hypothetical protein
MLITESHFPENEVVLRRWPSAADFYGERDNRTKLELADLDLYSSRPIEIWIDPTRASSSAIQQTALIACNLTARWARNIHVRMQRETLSVDGVRRDGHDLLSERIISEMRAADPFGDFRIVPLDSKPLDGSPLRLFIGPWNDSPDLTEYIAEDDYVVAAIGRLALGNRGAPIERGPVSETPLTTAAAGLAASLGVADLFKRAVGHGRGEWLPDFRWDLWEQRLASATDDAGLPVKHCSRDLGRIMIAGVGAIGSSLLYLLDLWDATGSLLVLDRDRVETSNLNRSLVFNVSHVLDDLKKTEIAERFLSRGRLSSKRLDGTWHEHAPSISREPFDVWISFTNEDGAWAELPFHLPPVVLQGTTTSGWGFGAGRHVPRKEDCTLCRMPRPEAVFRGPCAEGEIAPDEANPPLRASLPFLSAASAALVLAELVKINLGDVRDLPNEISVDLRTGLPAVISLKRRAGADCRGCTFLQMSAWQDRGGRGRFRNLST